MNITVNRQLLYEAVSHLSRAVAVKSTLPVLEGILLSAEKNHLTMMSYNLEIGMTKQLEATVEDEGDIVIGAKLFADILRSVGGETVTIKTDEKLLCHITSGTSQFDLPGMEAADFPEMPSMVKNQTLSLPADILKSMVRQTIFSVAPEESARPVLTGILFELEKNTIRLVAVDGYRLAFRYEPIVNEIETKFIVSGKAIGEAVRIIKDNESRVTLQIGQRHVSFKIDGYVLISRLLEGEFIDYKNTLSANYSTTARVQTREMISIIERMSLLINDQLKTPVRLTMEENMMLFQCSTAVGRAKDHYDAQIEGGGFEIGFNNRYLVEALRATESDEVFLRFNGPFSPIVVTPVQGEAFLYMIMPMRLKERE